VWLKFVPKAIRKWQCFIIISRNPADCIERVYGEEKIMSRFKAGLFSGVWVLLLFVAVFGAVLNVPVVWGSGTIYIRADGSIDPPTAPITTVDNVTYTFTDNISDSIVVERDNIVVDGAGYTVQGTGVYLSKGIYLSARENVTIRNMEIKAFGIGIWLEYSSNNSISENNITDNSDGIWLHAASYNNVFGNSMTNSYDSVLLEYSSSSNNIFENNIINSRDYSIVVHSGCSNNKIFHNNFINNVRQVYSSYSVSTWDDGYPSGGNYWSDYAGVDLLSGPYQNETGSDGIGDTPYIIDANNTDHYPLMNPYGAPPPPAYFLTITATVGGTTDPAAGTYGYTANSTVQVTATPNANYLFDYWELDSVNVGSANPYSVYMDKDHTLKAVFSPIPPPLSVSISPLSASILVGQSVTFTSQVSGGYTPYNYQWYLNGNPVSGATAASWTFTPTTSGIYYIYLKVTDAKANTAQSDTARITAATVPVGGYSYPINKYTLLTPIATHIALIAILTATFIKVKRKTKREH
jgi:parallel beta-helix repeat protein